jgi:Protein of unknown function, DUF255.
MQPKMMRLVSLCGVILAALASAYGQSVAAKAAAGSKIEFAPVGDWKNALMSGDAGTFRGIYSATPPAKFVEGNNQQQDISKEIDFWQEIKSSGAHTFDLNVTSSEEQPPLRLISFEASYKVNTPTGPRSRYVFEKQAWLQQGSSWRVVVATHSAVLKMPQPSNLNPNLYPKNIDAKAEIKEAVALAAHDNKRVLLVFGGNWCYDCHVLDFALHHSDAAPIVDHSFLVVHVDIGEGKLNPDLVDLYKIPLKRGVPAVAVLDSTGKLLYSDQNGEFEKARSMDPDVLISFLNKWKPHS